LGRFAPVAGPVLVGVVAVLSGDARLGSFSVLLVFVAGAWLLSRMDLAAGERQVGAT